MGAHASRQIVAAERARHDAAEAEQVLHRHIRPRRAIVGKQSLSFREIAIFTEVLNWRRERRMASGEVVYTERGNGRNFSIFLAESATTHGYTSLIFNDFRVGGERGIRSLESPLESVTYRF